jgi:catechol 2,3-dioxygenase-like lactoylglutathione lyase family enzyme
MRRYDHIDLRVRNLTEARPFYETLLPALGFTRQAQVEGWLQFETLSAAGGATAFFGVTESPRHVANENRVAFWVDTLEEVNRVAAIAVRAGARNVEGPMVYDGPHYYAVFFEDLCGNRFEICYRTKN